MTAKIRPLRAGDVWQVLAIERQAFPEDPWASAAARGWMNRSGSGRNPRHAARLARLLQRIPIGACSHLLRLAGLVITGRPATMHYSVAVADGVAGYGRLRADAGSRGVIQALAVRRGLEGQGIGTALLNELIATAAARECHEVLLYVRAGNDRARRLYGRAGFTDAGLRPSYYQPSGADAIVMRLAIASSPTRHRRPRMPQSMEAT
jgi:ribosomal protein S18 acetylase RimI-like enzyme